MSQVLRQQIQKLAGAIQDENYQKRRYLVGRILTVTDAALPDPDQRKAVKDLIETAMWSDSPLGGDDTITYHFKQFAQAQGIPELYDEPEAMNSEPVNPYSEIK